MSDVYEYRVEWESGHIETITGTDLFVAAGHIRVKDGDVTLLMARGEDIRTVRNLTLAPDTLGGEQ